MGEMVHLRLDSKLRKEMKSIIKDNLFQNETEFIRDSIRRNIELYRKIQVLKSLRGSGRGKTPVPIPRSEVFRVLGLED